MRGECLGMFMYSHLRMLAIYPLWIYLLKLGVPGGEGVVVRECSVVKSVCLARALD